MSNHTRQYQFTRRNKPIIDLSKATPTTGNLTLADIRASTLWKSDHVHHIGLATSSEVNLDPSRWPIRVRLTAPAPFIQSTDTVCRYWPIISADGTPLPFQAKSTFNEEHIAKLYSFSQNLDAELWDLWHSISTAINSTTQPPKSAVESTQDLAAYLEECRAYKKIPMIPIPESTFFLKGEPHGVAPANYGTISSDQITNTELRLCACINYKRLKKRHPDISKKTLTMCAYAIANMFALGFYEQFRSSEYYTAYMEPSGNEQFTIQSLVAPHNAPPVLNMKVGDMYDLSTLEDDVELVENSSALVTLAGGMHYKYNHTTGGHTLRGPLASFAQNMGVFDQKANRATKEKYTSVFYECLRPTNKRLIANMFFKDSRIYAAGRHSDAPRTVQIATDSIIGVKMDRNHPIPAGGHKGYVAAEVLKMVLDAGLGPFLPWFNEINECIAACGEVISAGARAHVGSMYYTGEARTFQGCHVVDKYVPELAAYVRIMVPRSDEIAMSAHMSEANAARANTVWVNLLKSIRDGSSGTSVERARIAFDWKSNDKVS